MKRRTLQSRSGFTLIEMVLALGLGSLLLTALMFQVYSLSNIWLTRNDDEFFVQHADGVSGFLNSAIERAQPITPRQKDGEAEDESFDEDVEAAPEEAQNPDDSASEESSEKPSKAQAVGWEKPPGFSKFSKPLIAWRMQSPPPLLQAEALNFPGVTLFLYYEQGVGLGLVWYSQFGETEEIDDVYTTPISQYVTQMDYAYYDAENDSWETFDEPEENDDGEQLLPDFVVLTFEYEDQRIQRKIHIPQPNKNVPLF